MARDALESDNPLAHPIRANGQLRMRSRSNTKS